LARNIASHVHPSQFGLPEYDRFEGFDRLLTDDPIVFIESSAITFESDVREIYRRTGADVLDSPAARGTQCIAPTREYAKKFNDVVRALYHPAERDPTKLYMQLYDGDRFYLTKNDSNKFKNLQDPDGPPLRVNYYNGRLLHVVGIYRCNKKHKSTDKCRCRLCKPGEADAGECMRRLDQVPRRRRGPTLPDDRIAHHADGVPPKSSPYAQMLVARDESGNYIEVSVTQMLQPRSKFQHGFAVTTHKMQGSQAPEIIFECIDDKPFNKWQQPYTAVTRPRQRLILIGSRESFKRMASRIAPPRRSTIWVHLAHTANKNAVPLGVWPEPLLSDEQNKNLWQRFETILSGGVLPTEKRKRSLQDMRKAIREKKQRTRQADAEQRSVSTTTTK
jgi:hypothetical protein